MNFLLTFGNLKEIHQSTEASYTKDFDAILGANNSK